MSDLVMAGTPEHEEALARVDAFDAETQRRHVGTWRFLWLTLTGRLCWRCRCQQALEGEEYGLCIRCHEVEGMLENVQ